jgi:hypothetical protein
MIATDRFGYLDKGEQAILGPFPFNSWTINYRAEAALPHDGVLHFGADDLLPRGDGTGTRVPVSDALPIALPAWT